MSNGGTPAAALLNVLITAAKKNASVINVTPKKR
jgi:hypothetical protein